MFKNFTFYLIIFFILSFISDLCAQSIGPDEALALAKETTVVEAFYNLNQGILKSCVENQVVRACDSGWVTCIDDAWVVKFFVSEKCVSPRKEQLGVTLLMDGKTGDIISKYPEIDYFENPYFCREDYDCLNSSKNDYHSGECKNFIYTLAENTASRTDEQCLCRNSRCEMLP